MKVGIIAALPGELKPLVRGWRRVVPTLGTQSWIQKQDDDVWIAVCGGMGAGAARRAFAVAEADGPLDLVLSVGWAGAMDKSVPAGEARAVSVVIDAQTGERFLLDGERRHLTLATAPRVADAAEKVRLRREYGAMLVDMEAATIARIAEERGIAMGCVKGISDGVDASMPNLNVFVDEMGQLRMAPFLLYLALRPKYWGPVMELGRNSAKAALAMRDLILEFLQKKNVERIRTGSAQ